MRLSLPMTFLRQSYALLKKNIVIRFVSWLLSACHIWGLDQGHRVSVLRL